MKADLLLKVLVCCVSFIKWMFLRTVAACCIQIKNTTLVESRQSSLDLSHLPVSSQPILYLLVPMFPMLRDILAYHFAKTENCREKNFFRGPTAPSGPGSLIIELSQSHSDTPHSIGQLWMSDQPDAEITTANTTLTRQRSMLPARFEPVIPVNERLQTHALDGRAIGIGSKVRT